MATWENLDSSDSEVEETHIGLMTGVCRNSSDDFDDEDEDFSDLRLLDNHIMK